MRHRGSHRGILVARSRACWIRFGDHQEAAHGGSTQQQVEKKAMHRLAVAERTDSRWHSPDAITDSRTEKTYRLGVSDLTDMRWGFRFDSADGIANSTRATSSLREVEPVGCPGDDAKRKRGARGGTKTSKRATKNSFWRLRITSSQSSSSCAAPLVPQPPREAPPQHMLVGPHVVRPRFLRPCPPRGPPPCIFCDLVVSLVFLASRTSRPSPMQAGSQGGTNR